MMQGALLKFQRYWSSLSSNLNSNHALNLDSYTQFLSLINLRPRTTNHQRPTSC